MTVKKVISFSFLLLANIIILVHPVVFHHHDHSIIDTVCVADQEHHCDDAAKHHHSHNTENAGNCCVVKNCLLNTPFTNVDSFKQIKPAYDNLILIVNYFSADQVTPITDLAGLPFRQKPYLLLFYPEFISQSIGLRAPPFC